MAIAAIIAYVASNASAGPANRPSKRNDIIAAATDLLATDTPELVTVGDIARHSGLTSAAIYYHFRSRDEVIDEIVTTFAVAWSALVTEALEEVTSTGDFAELIERHNDWVEANSRRATVYFLSSVGTTTAIETVRRDTRYQLCDEAMRALKRLSDPRSTVDLTVRALGVINLLEVGSTEWLRSSASYQPLGRAKFRKSLVRMIQQLVE